MHPSDRTYDKGYNYVTTTFVNMKLQEFIFDEMEKFNIIPRESECINRSSITDKILVERLLDARRFTSLNPFFRILDYVFPCEFESTGKPKMFEEYYKCLERLNEKMSSIEKIEQTPLTRIALKLFIDLKHCLGSRGVFKNVEGSKTEFFTNVYRAFNDFFTRYFIYKKETRRKLVSNRIVNIEGYSVIMNIYSIDIISPEISDETNRAYYMVYKFKKPGGDYIHLYKKAFLQIIPITSKINKYGLDDYYVSAGYFINKIFEYKHQTGMITFVGKETGKDYLFMGEIVNMDSLPYDESSEPLIIPEEKPRLVVRPFAGVPPSPTLVPVATRAPALPFAARPPEVPVVARPPALPVVARPPALTVAARAPPLPVVARPPAVPVFARPPPVPVGTPSTEKCVGGICRLKQNYFDNIPNRTPNRRE